MEILYPSVVLVQDRDVARKLKEYAGESMGNCVVKSFSPFEAQETPEGWEELGAFMERGKSVSDDGIEELNIVRKDEDVVVVLMTSGTTSLPKGCPHTNRSYVAQVLATNEMLGLSEGAVRKALNHAVPSHLMGANFSMMFHAAGLTVVHPAAVSRLSRA
jgi:acyl-coenzyme A synthetase/AMP-(fatty) acid ligase